MATTRPPLQEPSIAVLGPGLLGGSILRDIRELGCQQIRAWARRAEAAEEIQSLGLADEATTDLAQAVEGAGLIILASPAGSYADLAQRLAATGLAPGALVTDVGSIKGMVMAGAGSILAAAGIDFIGSHPMAGKEKAGLAASQPGLYHGAAVILTLPPGPEWSASHPQAQRLRQFWEALGGRPAFMQPEEHDRVVSRVSHLPHLAAVATVLTALRREPEIAKFAAGGLRDTTRVASGNPGMWQEILGENRANVIQAAKELQDELGNLILALEAGDRAQLTEILVLAKALRDSRYGSH